MECWTVVRPGVLPHSWTESAHRVRREGIPTDIPALNCARIVLCFKGTLSSSVAGGHSFPGVQMTIEEDGPSLTKVERESLMKLIRDTTPPEFVSALRTQLGKGCSDKKLTKLIETSS